MRRSCTSSARHSSSTRCWGGRWAAAAPAAGAAAIELGYQALDGLTGEFEGRPRPVSRAADHDAVIVHDFSTAGEPKGAQLTHANLLTTQAVVARGVLDLAPDDVVLTCSPLSHAFGLTSGLMAAICTASTVRLLAAFDPRRALEIVAAQHVTVLGAEPAMFTEMLVASDGRALDFGALRVCISGGPMLLEDTHRRYEERFGCLLLEGYGPSDLAPAACFNQPNKPRKAGSVGLPLSGVQLRVVEECGKEVPTGTTGQLQVRGDNVMKGYWNQPEATAAAIVGGWLCCGDTGYVDEDGYVYLVARA